jgi:type II secretory pathway pseudopilin PulG
MRRTNTAFTLVELLVATTILSCIVLLLLQITSQTSSFWINNEGATERQQTGRSILGAIASDLQGALLSSGGRNELQLVVNPDQVSSAYRNASAIFWQAPIATDRRLGDVAEIGYFVKWQTVGAPKTQLCRFFVNPVTSGTTAQANPDFLIYSQPENWISDSQLEEIAPADAANSYRGLLAENVAGMWVRCLAPNGDLITTKASGGAFSPGSFDSRLGYSWSGGIAPPNSLPAAIEVSIVVLDSAAGNRLTETQKNAITTLASGCADALTFASQAAVEDALRPIAQALRPYSTTVYLETSP